MRRGFNWASLISQGTVLDGGEMSRGMWRWWETNGAVDVWWARVEERPGQWRDVGEAEYGRAGLAPSFWDLPLQEDYIETVLGPDTVEVARARFQREFVLPGIIVLMFAFCVVFVVGVVGYAVLVQLGLLH
jgi:hypothetical protein